MRDLASIVSANADVTLRDAGRVACESPVGSGAWHNAVSVLSEVGHAHLRWKGPTGSGLAAKRHAKRKFWEERDETLMESPWQARIRREGVRAHGLLGGPRASRNA